MKRFRYPLQRLLEVRNLRKLQAEVDFGQALHYQAEAETELAKTYEKRSALHSHLRGNLVGTLDNAGLSRLQGYRQWVNDEAWRWEQEFQRRRARADEKRNEMLEKSRDNQALENHKDNSQKLYLRQYQWEQGKQLDEAGVLRFRSHERR